MRIRLAMAAMVLLATLPCVSDAQVNQCQTACCYCDLAVGQCKDISLFPGGGGTGYTNCNVNGMICNYWGSSCRDEFAFEEVGPDGLLRVASPEKSFPERLGTLAGRTIVADDGSLLELDCRRFVIAVRPEHAGTRAMAGRTSSIHL